MMFPCSGPQQVRRREGKRRRKTRRTRGTTDDGLSLPYDGITRTGSKGLSQLHRHRCGTPNETSEVTGNADFKQDSPGFDVPGSKFVPGDGQIQLKYFFRIPSNRR